MGYSEQVKSQAMALMESEGISSLKIGERLGIEPRTVRLWAARYREVNRENAHPAIMDDWYRITGRAQGIMHSVLDGLEGYAEIAQNDHPGPLAVIARQVAQREVAKQAVTMNIFAGTGSDKLIKDRQVSTGGDRPTGPIVIVFNAQKPETVQARAAIDQAEKDNNR